MVAVSVSGDTASADDFTAVSDFALTIPEDGQTGTARFTLTPEDDALAEEPETLSVTGTTEVTGLTVLPAELTITDDDTATSGVTLSVEPSVVGEDAGATEVTVTATLVGGVRSKAVIVSVTVAEDAEQYAVTPAAFDIEIPPEATSGAGTFTLTPVDDADDESDPARDGDRGDEPR